MMAHLEQVRIRTEMFLGSAETEEFALALDLEPANMVAFSHISWVLAVSADQDGPGPPVGTSGACN